MDETETEDLCQGRGGVKYGLSQPDHEAQAKQASRCSAGPLATKVRTRHQAGDPAKPRPTTRIEAVLWQDPGHLLKKRAGQKAGRRGGRVEAVGNTVNTVVHAGSQRLPARRDLGLTKPHDVWACDCKGIKAKPKQVAQRGRKKPTEEGASGLRRGCTMC